MGILNLDNHEAAINRPFPAHDHISAQAFEKEYQLSDPDGKLEELL